MTAATEAASEAGVAVGVEEEEVGAAQPPTKLERLQKILSQAGIASRRHAEEMIVAGRVMVNGQVMTQLGSKADPKRDHIRVDGKLLQGAERYRYFVLNKPKGYVTTVSDPEGRPTVMRFFAKMHERLYPVGRLDYQSEGLLLMTNDGELANLLTKAGSGVEKIYLVKVAGQPSEEELERLRGGVAIEKGEAGSERVRSAPARIRQVRVGENPWYEVVLTEGRNRELRKMFAGVGHFAEKIRRVGYGPLVLDVEPGKLRELTADEVNALRLTAEGKMKPRRVKVDRVLPKEAGRGSEKRGERPAQPWRNRPAGKRFEKMPGQGGKPFRQQEERGQRTEWKPREQEFGGSRRGSSAARSGVRKEWGPREREFGGRSEGKPFLRKEKTGFAGRGGKPPKASSDFGKRQGRPSGARPGFGGGRRESGGGRFENAPRTPFRAQGERQFFKQGDRPKKRFEGARPPFKRDDEGKRRDEITKRAGGESGKDFGKGAKFGAQPGGFGKSRGDGERGSKSGFSRPGAQRGGWKRRG
jgi:23S rRNA pseudouridine2605 synthase